MKAAIAFLVLLAPVAAQGQLLKCIGKDGGIEYATQCPPGTQEQQTGIKSTREGPSSSGATSPQQKSIAEREAEFRKRQMEGAEVQKKEEAKAAELAQNRENCERARIYLKSLQEGQRITQVDRKTGELVYLEDPARPVEIARAQQAANSWCK
ncbi:MAG: hypothetical protein ACRET7_01140 [Burkholderiales bacterium]